MTSAQATNTNSCIKSPLACLAISSLKQVTQRKFSTAANQYVAHAHVQKQAAIDLIKLTLSKEDFLNTATLTKHIKSFTLNLTSTAPIEEAISTSGGINLNAVSDSFELKNLKNQYCIGEMLDWNAPTGGYLIQGCASSGVYLAKQLNQLESSNLK